MHGVGRLAPAVAATVQPTAIACWAEKLERSDRFSVALGSSAPIISPRVMASGGDCVVRSAIPIASLRPFGLLRQRLTRDSRR
jgi:hypothetical protein